MFFRSLDLISHDVSGTENFRMIERSRHDQRWGMNSAQATNSGRIKRIEWLCVGS